MQNFKATTVGRIVADDFRFAQVFDRYKIDFCSNGSVPFTEACRQAGADPDAVLGDLETARAPMPVETDFKNWPLDLLIDYIRKFHHRNIRKQGPDIAALTDRVCRAHGDNHPELFEVRELFVQSLADLGNHLQKEEGVLFPYLYQLYEAGESGLPLPRFHCGSIGSPVAVMMAEHDAEGGRYRRISHLTRGYALPADGCGSYRILLEKLKAFEQALHHHIHLENNILFPRALEMEAALAG